MARKLSGQDRRYILGRFYDSVKAVNEKLTDLYYSDLQVLSCELQASRSKPKSILGIPVRKYVGNSELYPLALFQGLSEDPYIREITIGVVAYGLEFSLSEDAYDAAQKCKVSMLEKVSGYELKVDLSPSRSIADMAIEKKTVTMRYEAKLKTKEARFILAAAEQAEKLREPLKVKAEKIARKCEKFLDQLVLGTEDMDILSRIIPSLMEEVNA